MNSFTKKGFTSSIITSIILAVLGILLIVATEATIISISYIIGGILILLGFFGLVDYIRKIDTETKTSVDLVYGIVTVILGVLIVVATTASCLSRFFFCIGFFAIQFNEKRKKKLIKCNSAFIFNNKNKKLLTQLIQCINRNFISLE